MALIIVIFITIIFVAVQYKVYKKYWNRDLSVDIAFSKHLAGEYEPFDIVETVENRKFLPLPSLLLKYATGKHIVSSGLTPEDTKGNITDKLYLSDAVPVMGYKRVIRRLPCYSVRRGIYTIDDIFLYASNLTLSANLNEVRHTDATLLVHPRFLNTGETDLPFDVLSGELIAKVKYIEDPFAFRGIRNYTPDDSMKFINWKASARSMDLMVNEFSQTIHSVIKIILNFSQETIHFEHELLEEELRLAVSLAREFLLEGFEVSLDGNAKVIFNDEYITVEQGSGYAHLKNFLETSAGVIADEPVKDIYDTDLKNKLLECDDFVVFIGFNQSDKVIDLWNERINSGKDGMWIIPVNHYVKVSAENARNVKVWKTYEKK